MSFVEKTVLGVMSGTSLDGIDLALVHFEHREEWRFTLQHGETIAYPSVWKNRLQQLTELSLQALRELDVEYTKFLGEVIQEFLVKHRVEKLDFVASHGHTALHQPEQGITYQIGNLPHLATSTGQQVICDFRVADVNFGGQGAPLVPGGEVYLFKDYVACVNLGGFANITQLHHDPVLAYDITAVNVVLNFLANKLGLPYDDKGRIAQSGKMIPSLFDSLNALAFYQTQPPKSLGLEWVQTTIFPLLAQYEHLAIEDLLHTYSVHSAKHIANELPKNGKVLFSGGGAFNTFLMEHIKRESSSTLVLPEKGIIEYKEAVIFAFLGVLRELNLANCLASVTGAPTDHSSGKIFYP